jgi:hypothetical protein
MAAATAESSVGTIPLDSVNSESEAKLNYFSRECLALGFEEEL